ncbi:MAG: hypothetical protein IJO06_06080 [Thermoguttaceae bacterium]|nr:hypothetical protein [Thermoguttaceae bacterium]
MRNGTKKAAAVAGLSVLGAALWGLGYRQGAQSGQGDLAAETAQVAEEAAKTPILAVARDLPIAENDAIPALDGRCEARLETSATEIPLGDAVYCRFVERNVAQDGTPIMLMNHNAPVYSELGESAYFLYLTLGKITFETPKIAGEYVFVPEFEGECAGFMGYCGQVAVAPGEEYEYGTLGVEFPPLEDWNEPFWRGVRELLATEGRVELRMRIPFTRRIGLGGEATPFGEPPHSETDWTDTKGVFEKKIVLTRRPETETKRFEEWFASTSDELWPVREKMNGEATFKFPPEFTRARNVYGQEVGGRKIRASGRSGVELDGFAQTFDIWNFVRFGNRKPSDPNNPTTLDGWRKLEAEFSPSTVRDEMTLTRLLLEYYSAEMNEEEEAALRRLGAWLDSLDPAQRAAYKNAILAKAWMLNPKLGGGMGTPVNPAETRGAFVETADASGLTRKAKSAEDIEMAQKWRLLSEALGRKSGKARKEAGKGDFIPALM